MGTKSSLATETYLAHSSNYTKGRRGYKICKFTPHHMAGILTAKQCGAIFQNSSRNASSNYGIGNDGTIACYVEEENRAWTSSSSSNDCQAITVEVSNCQIGGQWKISDAAWKSLVNLAVDVCRRYNFRLKFDGTPKGSLTYHSMFASTSCPGPYLKSKMNELAETVNKILDGKEPQPAKPQPSSTTRKVGDTVTINGVYTASNSTKKLNPARTTGKITKIINGARNPYLLDNGNLGWVNDSVIVSASSSSSSQPAQPSKKSATEVAQEVIAGKWGNGDARKTNLTKAGYNYNEIQNKVNELMGVKTSSSSNSSNSSTTFKKGDRVRVKNGAKDYNGTKLSSAVYTQIYNVIQVNGDRIVIGKGTAVTAAMHKNNLTKV